MKKTVLCDEHINLGARMVEFAGWYMPVQYKGLIEEHTNCRKNVGIFDVSHMGEIFVEGPKALETLQWLTTNDVSVLKAGQAQYSLLPNDSGGLVDDIIVYCIEPSNNYLVCVNASNIEKDFQWMSKHNKGAKITNRSDEWSQIAIQGPNAKELVERVLGQKIGEIPYFNFITVNGGYLARTGYTGEEGFEYFIPNKNAVAFWRGLIEKGQDLGVQPVGLGARDTLRLEMKYSLYGHEINDTSNPYGAGLGWAVKPSKGDFMGKAAMEKTKPQLNKKLVGFKLVDKGVPRQDYLLFSFDNKEIGKVTSGTMSPSLMEPIGIAYIDSDWAQVGKEFLVQIRSRMVKAQVVKTPFVNPKTK